MGIHHLPPRRLRVQNGSSQESSVIRVFIVDDHSIVRQGLKSYLELTGGFKVVGEAADGETAIAEISRLIEQGNAPDVALVDLVMPVLSGIELADQLRQLSKPPAIMILSSFGDVEHLRAALNAGVSGYILKSASAETIAIAIREANAGNLYLDPMLSANLKRVFAGSAEAATLTKREREVVALVAKGKANKEIAAELFISERTARTHVSHLLLKLNLRSRIQLALWAREGKLPS